MLDANAWAVIGAVGGYSSATVAAFGIIIARRARRLTEEKLAADARWSRLEARVEEIEDEAGRAMNALKVQVQGVQDDANKEFVRRSEWNAELDRFERGMSELRSQISSGFLSMGARIDRVLERLTGERSTR
jgi:hypothetical protein